MKYIDAEKLIAEIKRRSACEGKQIEDNIKQGFNIEPCHEYALSVYQGLLDFLDTIEAEQPEVDLEKGIEEYFNGWTETDEGIACHYQYVDLNTCRGIARHFYELGLKSKK